MVLSPINRSSLDEELYRPGMVTFPGFSMAETVYLLRVNVPAASYVGGKACVPANPHSPTTMLGHQNST